MQYIREIIIAVLLAGLCFATWQCDQNKGKLKDIDASKKRMENISSVQAGRKDVAEREKGYQAIDAAVADIKKQRGKIGKQEAEVKLPQRGDIEHEISKVDINGLADLFRRDGYGCTVLER
jgi:hypothetical protein